MTPGNTRRWWEFWKSAPRVTDDRATAVTTMEGRHDAQRDEDRPSSLTHSRLQNTLVAVPRAVNWDAAGFIALMDGLMRRAFSPSTLSRYGLIQERLDAAVYETPEFLDILGTCLTVCRDRLRELAAEVSKPEYPTVTPFLIYCHDQFEIGRKAKEFEMCRRFGRVLGEAMCRGKNVSVHAAEQERRYGLNISFIVAKCPRCGEANRGIPAAAEASTKSISSVPTQQSKSNGVAGLCSGCLRWFVAEWD